MESKNLNNSKKLKNQDNGSFYKFDKISCVFLLISLSLILIGIIGPINLNQPFNVREILLELRSVFIAVAGIILTFLAFYIQYKANESQKSNLKAEKLLNEKKNIENRIFDLVKIHHENVSNITLEIIDFNDYKSKSNSYYHTISGREVFKSLVDEYYLIYFFLSKQDADNENIEHPTFKFFYNGIYYQKLICLNFEKKFKDLIQIKHQLNNHQYVKVEQIINKFVRQNSILSINKNLFENVEQKLSSYFKHFMFLVDYIYSQDEEILIKKDKDFYYSFINSQLTSYEQLFIYLYSESKMNTKYSFDLNELKVLSKEIYNEIKNKYDQNTIFIFD